jgi:uncharacterized protein
MMQDVFSKLKILQDILSRKFEIEQEIHEIPKVLNTKNELLNRLKKSYLEKNNQVEETKELIRRLRIRLDEAQRQREGYEKQMDQISTQREYEALDKEIKDTTEKEQHFRKEILRQEKELEDLSYSLEQEEAMIRQQEDELKSEHERIELESEDKKKLLKDLELEEENISPGLDEEILFKFERIIRSKSGLGIVPVKESVCTGCHMMLPAQFENDVRSGEYILFCPYCSRILFYEEEDVASDDYVVEDDSGSLTDLIDMDDFGLEE